MRNNFKQLIPGNPGSSFVTALLYAVANKYGERISNCDQLTLFSKGIVNSRNVFFSGIVNEVARHFNRQITIYSDTQYLLDLADEEIDKKLVNVQLNPLEWEDFDKIIEDRECFVFSVDMWHFKKYHDYHYVCFVKKNNGYKMFDPKSGNIRVVDKWRAQRLIRSIPVGLKDHLICFTI